jgi:thiol-disulfide isomerase/thioredoxin
MHWGRLTGLAAAVLAALAVTAAQAAPVEGSPVQGAVEGATLSDAEKYAFSLEKLDGSGELSFAELAESGKPFIIVWWLSECPVCHLQLPYVQQLQKLSADGETNVRVVSINLDQNTADGLKYAKDKGISFELLSDPRGRHTDKQYHIKELGTPVTYVFKAGGVFVDYMSGFKSGYAKAVLNMLEEEIPAELASRG